MIQNKFEQATNANPFEIDPWQTLLGSLGIGLCLAIALRWHFQVFGSTLSNRREFSRNFPLIMLTTILVISVVKSSLALSLGLVGALSIVRFRTPIKEPEELAYLFLTIGLGLGLGAGKELRVPTMVAAGAIMLGQALVQWRRFDHRGKGLFLSLEWSPPNDRQNPLDEVTAIIGKHASSNDVRRVDTRAGQLDATFFVDLSSMGDLSDLLAHLTGSCPGVRVTVIDQTRMPSV